MLSFQTKTCACLYVLFDIPFLHHNYIFSFIAIKLHCYRSLTHSTNKWEIEMDMEQEKKCFWSGDVIDATCVTSWKGKNSIHLNFFSHLMILCLNFHPTPPPPILILISLCMFFSIYWGGVKYSKVFSVPNLNTFCRHLSPHRIHTEWVKLIAKTRGNCGCVFSERYKLL